MTETQDAVTRKRRLPWLGILSAIMGLGAAKGVTVIWLLSTTSLDLPGWARILGGWLFPVGALASVGLGIAARVRRSGPRWALAGFILSGLSVLAFVVMIATVSY